MPPSDRGRSDRAPRDAQHRETRDRHARILAYEEDDRRMQQNPSQNSSDGGCGCGCAAVLLLIIFVVVCFFIFSL